mmetsp:Transcript_24600/g.71136  ORF Transcript_24600/g.71136 Transcript_24600/m.71136 type:complete len:254 (-) Transcript_24600:879-1640(-)
MRIEGDRTIRVFEATFLPVTGSTSGGYQTDSPRFTMPSDKMASSFKSSQITHLATVGVVFFTERVQEPNPFIKRSLPMVSAGAARIVRGGASGLPFASRDAASRSPNSPSMKLILSLRTSSPGGTSRMLPMLAAACNCSTPSMAKVSCCVSASQMRPRRRRSRSFSPNIFLSKSLVSTSVCTGPTQATVYGTTPKSRATSPMRAKRGISFALSSSWLATRSVPLNRTWAISVSVLPCNWITSPAAKFCVLAAS